MKRLLLLLLLILIPLASATIEVDGPSKDKYNLGDEIDIRGYILREDNIMGFLIISLDCQEEIPLVTKSVSVKENTRKNFEESFIIPFYMTGNCALKISLSENGNVIEQSRSKEFTISKDLEGNFILEDKLIQLGKDVKITGNVYRLDGSEVNGNAIIYFKKNSTIANVGSSSLVDGKFEYILSSVAYPSGIYNIEIEALDTFGNQFTFFDIEPFTLVNEIYVFAKPSKLDVLPDSVVKIFGEAKTILQEKISEARVTLMVNNKSYETTLKDSDFEYELVVEEDSKSGRHNVGIIVEDNLGNIGRTTTNFNVKSIPTSLFIDTELKSFIPGTKINFKPVLLDQGGDFIIEDIGVELIDSEGDVKFTKVVKTNEDLEYEFEQYSLPGTWTVKIFATGLVHEDQIYIGETLASDFSLEGQILTITNIGNIIYKRPIEIRLEGDEVYTVVEKQKLYPGESYGFDLGENVKSGVYSIFVGEREFNDVEIVGFMKRDYSILYWSLSGIVIFLILILFFKSMHKKRKIKKEKEKEEENLADKVKDFLTKKGIVHKKEEKKVESETDRMGRYKKEFKEKILHDIKKREKKIRQDVSKFLPKESQDYLKIKAPEKKNKSLMDIFNMKDKKVGGEK